MITSGGSPFEPVYDAQHWMDPLVSRSAVHLCDQPGRNRVARDVRHRPCLAQGPVDPDDQAHAVHEVATT